MLKGQFKRRYLIDKRYQLTQSLGLVVTHLLVALFAVLMTVWFYLFVIDRRLIHNHNSALLVYLFVGAIVLTSISVYASLCHSHRIAGMIYKLEMIFKDVRLNRYPDKPVSFRRRDYFHWLTPSLNDALNHCRQQETALDDLYKKIEVVRTEIVNGNLRDMRMVADELETLDRGRNDM